MYMSQMSVGQPMLSAILVGFDYDLRCFVCCGEFIWFAVVISIVLFSFCLL